MNSIYRKRNYIIAFCKSCWLGIFLFLSAGLCAQEICNNGMDDDGDFLIDCFDPDCCNDCFDHYFYDCDTICDAFQLKDSIVLQRLWRQTMDWDRRSTPIIGQLVPGEISIIGPKNTPAGSTSNKDLLVVNGTDGSIKQTITTPWYSNYGQSIGIADLNNDGLGEIVVGSSESASDERYLFCYDNTGIQLWQSSDQFGYRSSDVNLSPQFADFNEDGNPEVYVGNQIFNGMTGDLICEGGSSNNYGLQASKNTLYRFYATSAADVLPSGFCADCDGLELIAGNQVYSVNVSTGVMSVVSEQMDNAFHDGLTAIADMNGDQALDIVVAQRINDFVNIWVWDPRTGNLLGRHIYSYPSPDNFSGASSVPLLTDIDFDGDVDIIFSTTGRLVALNNDGSGNLGRAWTYFTNDISGRSGPVAFDFDGNGIAEIVHRGSEVLRVLNAPSGTVLDTFDCYSPTYFDKAVVANIDDDPGAEIVCSCGNELWVFTSGYSQWSNTRPVWNQMHYYNTHIRDDLSVPSKMQSMQFPQVDGRFSLNRYLEQYSQPEKPASDLYFANVDIQCSNGNKTIIATICNQGEIRAPRNINFSIYTQDPLNNPITPEWTVQIPQFIVKGGCDTFQYDYPVSVDHDTLYFAINTISSASVIDTNTIEDFVAVECRYANNFVVMDVTQFNSTSVSLQNDTTLCPGSSITLDAGSQYFEYLWNDNSTDRELKVDQSGTYALTVTDDCGNIASDSVEVDVQFLPDPDFPADTTLCLGDTLLLSINAYDSVHWVFNNTPFCSNCDQIDFPVLNDGLLYSASWLNACVRNDSIVINTLETPVSRDTVEICPNDSVLVNNEWVGPGIYTNMYVTSGPCDSVAITHVQLQEQITYSFATDTLCHNENTGNVSFNDLSNGLEILWSDGNTSFNRDDLSPGNYSFTLTGTGGCQIVDELTIGRLPSPIASLIAQAPGCTSDSLGSIDISLINDNYEVSLDGNRLGAGSVELNDLMPGTYQITIHYANCALDTSIVFESNNLDSLFQNVELNIEYGDSILLGNEIRNVVSNPTWQPSSALSCSNCIPVLAFPINDMNFTLTATDALGCPVQKTYFISVDTRTEFYIPNVFSPNSDGINDNFTFTSSIPIRNMETFLVYDRWGNLITEKHNLGGSEIELWDGTFKGQLVSSGVYIYYIQLVDINGNLRELGGDITVVR